MTLLASPPSDAVSEVLRTFGVRSTIFCRSELRTPWAFRVSDEPVAKFHLVLEGSALLTCAGQSTALAGGDLVVLPRGVGHTLAGDDGAPAPPLERLLVEHGVDGGVRLRYGGSGPLTRLLCGGFSLAEGIPASMLNLFPDVLHVPFERAGAPWVARLLTELEAEAGSGRPGASAIITKITDVFLAQALRVWLLDGGDGLADSRWILEEPIAKAVRALNSRSSEPWSLDRLARHVGLSRTSLASKFRREVGEAPMRYLSDVRLRRAAEELAQGRGTLHEIARRAAYETDAAFAKAFKRRFGLSPGSYRDSAREPPSIDVVAIR
jgi:AraC-like DNA-binding protein